MENLLFWIAFLGIPMLLVLISLYVYRPSMREKYREAKRIPFLEPERYGR
jgi:cbb3-type cytochrome oxidase subunit 3